LVWVWFVCPVAAFLTEILAFATAAPEGPVMAPASMAPVTCASNRLEIK